MIEAELPDGTVLEFPEGTAPDVVQRVVKQRLGVADKPTFGSMFKDELMRPVRAVRDLAAGAVRGAGSLGATLMAPRDAAESFIARQMGAPQLQAPERRNAMTEALQGMGADPESMAFGAGKLGAEIAGTAGVGGALAGGAQGMGAAPAVVNALRTGGMTTGASPAGFLAKAGDLALRSGAGAVVGGASAAAVGDDAGTGAAISGALPVGLKAAGKAGQLLGQGAQAGMRAFSANAAQNAAAQRILEALDPTEIARLNQRGKIPLSVAALTRNPSVAQMEQGSRLRTPNAWYDFDQNQGRAVFDSVMDATGEAADMANRAASRRGNWNANWAKVEAAIDPQVFGARIPKFQQDIDTALMSAESANPAVRSFLESVKDEIARTGEYFSPAHLQQIRANLNGRANPISPNAFAAAPRDSAAVKSVIKEIDDILNASSGGAWSNVTKGYADDTVRLHESKAASKVRSSFVDQDSGRILGTSLDPNGDVAKITEAGLGRSMNAARQPVTNKLALSQGANGELETILEALRNQNIVQGVKRSATAGGGSDTVSNAVALAPGGMTKNVLVHVIEALKNAGTAKTENELAKLLTDPKTARVVLNNLANKQPNVLAELLREAGPQAGQLLYRAAPISAQ